MASSVIETRIVSVTPTIDTEQYTSGDAIGGLMTFSNALRSYTRSGRITAAQILDKASASTLASCTLWIFSANPSKATTTNNSAFVLPDAELTNLCGAIEFTSSDAYTINASPANQVLYKNGLYVPVWGAAPTNTNTADTDIYGVLESGGTPTFAVGDLTIRLVIECD